MKKIILFTLFLIIFCISGFAQGNKDNSTETAVSIENSPADEGEISGRLPQYNVYNKDYDFLKRLERPELTLAFDSNNRLEIEKLKNLVEILDSHWQNVIKFFYESEIEKFPDALNQSISTIALTEINEANINKIRSVSIEAPNGKRNVSQNEASGIITFLNTIAKNLIIEAKEFKGKFTGVKLKNKPQPSASGNHKCKNSGNVTLRVTFDKSAKVTLVQVLSPSGCEAFDESSIRAAKRIKFKPAMIDGNPITLSKTIIYSYITY